MSANHILQNQIFLSGTIGLYRRKPEHSEKTCGVSCESQLEALFSHVTEVEL